MSLSENVRDEDLALYAMGSLSQQESDLLALELDRSAELRDRMAEVLTWLCLYAETVEPSPVPDGNLERLMNRIGQEKSRPTTDHVISFPQARASNSHGQLRRNSAPAWIGWAVAACLAVTTGALYVRRPHQTQTTSVASSVSSQPSVPVTLIQERDALKADLAEKERAIQQLTSEVNKTAKEAETLRTSVAGQSAKLKGRDAVAAEAQARQEALSATVAAQADQVAQVSRDSDAAKRIMASFTDPSALHVNLTKPKSHPVPTGRATYVLKQGTLIFLASNLTQLKDGKVYQLWLMPADSSQPVPAGTFAPDAHGNASVVYAQFSRAVAAKGFSVTIENEGGALAPTLPIVLAGPSGA